jgi:ABC-type amino acid transport substrate-binding protein
MRRLVVALGTLGLFVQPALSLDLAEVRQRGKLLVLIAGDPAAPVTSTTFLGRDGSVFVGLEGEILAGFASRHKLELELVYVPSWDKLIPSLLAARGDLIAGGLTRTEERRKVIEFTAETFPTRDVVLTRKPRRVVQTLQQLREEQVGIAAGTSHIDTLRAAGVPPDNIKIISDPSSLPELMRAGTITATVQGVEVAVRPPWATDPDFELGMFLGPPQSLAMGLRKEDRQLLAALNDHIGNLRKTPTWSRLVVKYFGERTIEVLRRARGE